MNDRTLARLKAVVASSSAARAERIAATTALVAYYDNLGLDGIADQLEGTLAGWLETA